MNCTRCLSKCRTKLKRWRTKSKTWRTRSIIQSLLQIVNQIGDVFDAGRNPYQAVGQADRLPPFRRHRGVGHRRRMADERLDAAKTFRERHQTDAIADAARRLEGADIERDHAAEP